MANPSFVTYTGDGATTNFAVPFNYVSKTFVYVTVSGVSTAFTWVNASTIQISPAPVTGSAIKVYRDTEEDLFVTLSDNVPTPASAYNKGLNQSIQYAQEVADRVGVNEGQVATLLAGGFPSASIISSVAAIRALTSAYSAASLLLLSYHVGASMGGGMFYYDSADVTSADDGFSTLIDTLNRRWKRVNGKVLTLSMFGAVGDGRSTDRDALIAAVGALYNTEYNYFTLDGEGVEILLDQKTEFTVTNLTTGAGYKRINKIIRNLNLKATGTSWIAGDCMLKFAGDQTEGNLRALRIQNCRFDAAEQTGVVPLRLGGYYLIRVDGCTFTRFTADALQSLGLGDATGNHGLIIENNTFLGEYATPTGRRAIYTEDGDVVVRGNTIEWVGEGMKSMRGSLKVEFNHFSIASQASMVSAVTCVAPRGVAIIGNDFDGCYIDFNNYENNLFDGTHLSGWQNLTIEGNDFLAGNNMPAGFGFINFRTDTASNFITNLTVLGNWFGYTGTGGPFDAVHYATTGAGTWLATFVSTINNPKVSTVNPGNHPGLVRIAANNTAGIEFDATGNLVPNADGGASLGTNALQFAEVRASTRYRIAGIQVVGARGTGWTADTGTDKRTANATYSGTAEVGYTQATVQTLMDAVRDLSQTIKALKADLTTHGLIGT